MKKHEPKLCRTESCNAPILWAQVLKGDRKSAVKRKPDGKPQAMPVNFQPTTDSRARVVLFDREGTIVAYVLKEGEAPLAGEQLRIAHHITCPGADDWRNRQKHGRGRSRRGR